MTTPRTLHPGSLLLVALLHALALLGLLAGLRPQPSAPGHAASQGVLILLPPLARPAADAPTPPAARAERPRAVAATPQPARAEIAADPRETVPVEPPLLARAQAASAPASAPLVGPSLLDSEATRRAVRMATREPLLSERTAAASDDPGRLNAQQRLGQEMAQAATGDCLKGEYAGGGMGLLSLPFWLAAEVRGKCRR